MTTDGELHRLALAMETLKGSMDTGFSTVRGDINLLARGESYNTQKLQDLEKDVNDLKARRFPLPTIGGLMGVAGVCVSCIALFQKG